MLFPLFQSEKVEFGIPVAFATSYAVTPFSFSSSSNLEYILSPPILIIILGNHKFLLEII
nr:MAG TPA: hypothetical protein [Caudoviricetes sp.]